MAQKLHQLSYTEFWRGRSGLTFGVEKVLFSEQSEFQRIEVLQTDAVGRVLTLDGLVMLTEWDEFVYHEMISHPALCLIDAPRQVLVVGGGDGGTVREVLRHPSVERVDLVEIDQMVIDVSRRFLPSVSSALDDERLTVHVRDGVQFALGAPDDSYDVIIIDSTDPVDFAEPLFGESFYQDCARMLTDEGILVAQSESPFDPAFRDTLQRAHRDLASILPHVHMYLAPIPTYPMGTWSFTLSARGTDPLHRFDAERVASKTHPFADRLQYYNAEIHAAAFALPNFVRRAFATPDPSAGR